MVGMEVSVLVSAIYTALNVLVRKTFRSVDVAVDTCIRTLRLFRLDCDLALRMRSGDISIDSNNIQAQLTDLCLSLTNWS